MQFLLVLDTQVVVRVSDEMLPHFSGMFASTHRAQVNARILLPEFLVLQSCYAFVKFSNLIISYVQYMHQEALLVIKLPQLNCACCEIKTLFYIMLGGKIPSFYI